MEYNFNNDFKKKLVKFATARIDLKNIGSSSNKIRVHKANNANVDRPFWFRNDLGEGVVLTSYFGKLDVEIECITGGELRIELRSIDFKDKTGKRVPIYIQYNKLIIDGKNILDSNNVVWHDKPFVYKQEVNDGEKVFIYLEWEPISIQSKIN